MNLLNLSSESIRTEQCAELLTYTKPDMSRTILFLVMLFIFNVCSCKNYKVLVVTGGHPYDTVQFFGMFDHLKGVEYNHLPQPEANQELAKGNFSCFDVLVFYDLWNSINDKEKDAFIELTKSGKPLLFLHHSIASYQDWPEFEKIIGGKYVLRGKDTESSELSTYKHDVWVNSKVIKKCPVTTGLDSLILFDEVYGNIKVSDNVIPLIQTNHPNSSEFIAWENRYNNSAVIYLQPGHDRHAYESKEYQQLLLQAIKFLAKQNQRNRNLGRKSR